MADAIYLPFDGCDAGDQRTARPCDGAGLGRQHPPPHYPSWVAQSCIGLLLIANVINLGADPRLNGRRDPDVDRRSPLAMMPSSALD